MKVLVTGATGFVGAHSVAALLGAGHGLADDLAQGWSRLRSWTAQAVLQRTGLS